MPNPRPKPTLTPTFAVVFDASACAGATIAAVDVGDWAVAELFVMIHVGVAEDEVPRREGKDEAETGFPRLASHAIAKLRLKMQSQ